MIEVGPMGPGFFIFFQQVDTSPGGVDAKAVRTAELIQDDNDMLDLIRITMESGILDE